MSKKFTGAPGKFAGTLPTVLMTFPAGSPDPVPTESYEELPHGTPAWINLAAGAFAGIAEHSVTFPIDSIKTRMQVLRPHPEAVYKDSFDALKSAAKSQEGLKRLWRGVWSVVIGAGPAHALYFGSYEQAKKLLVPANSDAASSPFAVGISGAIATSLADGFMTPFDVIKQRMQVHDSPFTSVYRCGLEVFRREGLSAFFVSYPTTLFLNIPFQMVQFPTYEFMRKLIHRDRDYDPVSHVVSGGLAGGLAAAVTTPIDVVKTTLQTRGLSTVEGDQLGNVRGMRDAIRFIHRERGGSGFTRGLGPRMLTHMPATAICWGFYEYLKSVLEIKNSA